MKRYLKKFLNGIIFGLGFFVIFILGIYLVKARSGLQSSPGDKLTSAKWNELVNNSQIPSGQISAFNLSSCPSGRSEFTPAYGRFLRGIDKSGTSIDPDGQRALGNIQNDAFQGHKFAGTVGNYVHPNGTYEWIGPDHSSVFAPGRHDEFNLQGITTIQSDGTNGIPRIANETRSKNVAVLYCVKN